MKRIISTILTLMLLFIAARLAAAQHNCGQCPAAKSCLQSTASADTSMQADDVYQNMPGGGKKVWIGNVHYFAYKFDKPPKLGVAVLNIQLFKANGAKDKTFKITGISGMLFMKESHQIEGRFKINRLGDQLLPINFSARGSGR